MRQIFLLIFALSIINLPICDAKTDKNDGLTKFQGHQFPNLKKPNQLKNKLSIPSFLKTRRPSYSSHSFSDPLSDLFPDNSSENDSCKSEEEIENDKMRKLMEGNDETLPIIPIKEPIVHEGSMKFKDITYNYKIHASRTSRIKPFSGQRNDCEEKRVFVAVKTAASHFKNRETIRKTRASKENVPNDYLVRFFIGGVTVEKLEEKILQVENSMYKDLVRYDLFDSYENLTLKFYALMEYHQKFCPHAQYLFEIDDDIAIDLHRLDHYIQYQFDPYIKENGDTLFCAARGRDVNEVVRGIGDKWFVPCSAYNQSHYPEFCPGAMALIPSGAVERILSDVENHNFITPDDALFTGIIRDKLNIGIRASPFACSNWVQQDYEVFNCKHGELLLNTPLYTSMCQMDEEGYQMDIERDYEFIKNFNCENNGDEGPREDICAVEELIEEEEKKDVTVEHENEDVFTDEKSGEDFDKNDDDVTTKNFEKSPKLDSNKDAQKSLVLKVKINWIIFVCINLVVYIVIF